MLKEIDSAEVTVETVEKSPEAFASVNGIEICYDTFGNPNDPALLLVMGLGVQLIGWPEDFCRQLAANGFYVIRYDNRDVGRSTWFDWAAPPTTRQLLSRILFGTKFVTPYSLYDMMYDGIGLLDALEINKAHVMGASMGGMLAQLIAIHHPERVLSLTSMMSTTGERNLKGPSTGAFKMLISAPPKEREAALDAGVKTYISLSGSKHPIDAVRMRNIVGAAYDRARHPAGTSRQLGAIANADGRRLALRDVTVPALVLHGDEDPLVRWESGVDTAEALPNARLVTIHGMGHTLPISTWPIIIGEFVKLAQRATG